MIVPRSRLIFWVTAVVVPAALIAGIIPNSAPVCFFLISGLAAFVIADAIIAPRHLAGVAVELPPIVRLSKDREGKIEVRIRTDQPQKRMLRVALDLPDDITTDPAELEIVLPAGSDWSRVAWPCIPSRRGNYRITAVYAGANSTLGFWFARKVIAAQAEIRVYPNLLTERKSLAAFLNRGTLGLHVQRQVGKGRDF